MRTGRPPRDLIDHNVRIDYGKLRHILTVDRRLNGNFSHLRSILESGEARAKIVTGFPIERLTDPNNFLSLLYYFGLLTFKAGSDTGTDLMIPNRTVKQLLYGHLRDGYRDVDIFRIDLLLFANLIEDMAFRGEWEPVGI